MTLAWVAALALLPAVAAAPAQQTAAAPARSGEPIAHRAKLTFAFDRPGLTVPSFVITVFEDDGTGTYVGLQTTPPGRNMPPPVPEPFEREIALSPASAKKIFALVHDLHDLNKAACASKVKNVADTGAKTLTYTDLASTSTCAYNYTENKNVQALTSLFQAIACTLDEGRLLDRMHRYDRLGLDAEIISFSRLLADGTAAEPGTIAPTLRSLANDPDLIQRVRTRAANLLAQIPQS